MYRTFGAIGLLMLATLVAAQQNTLTDGFVTGSGAAAHRG